MAGIRTSIDECPRQCVQRVAWRTAIPSLPSATSAADCSALFGCFIGTMERSDSSIPFMRVVLASAFSRRTGPLLASSRSRGLPVLVHVVSQRARGLRLRRADPRLALSPPVVWPSPSVNRVGAQNQFFEGQYPAQRCLCLRFACRLTTTHARLEAKMARYSFL